MAVDRRGEGELGRATVDVLDAAEAPMSPAQVREGLHLAYTTVIAVMSRLTDRAVLVRQPAGRGYAYTTHIDRAEVAALPARPVVVWSPPPSPTRGCS